MLDFRILSSLQPDYTTFPRVRTPYLTLCLSIAALDAVAQDLPQPIVGCEALGCPTEDNGAVESCNVAEESFKNVGLARISDNSDTFSGLSIVKGVNVSGSGSSPSGVEATYDYTSVYYLGGQSLHSLSGCAVIFHDTGALRFPGTSATTDTGVCSDVIADSCISSLERAARDVAANAASGSEDSYCSSLSQVLEEDEALRESCQDLTGSAGNGIGRFTVTPVGDFASVTESENSTSNCWPITPKSDGLSKVAEDEVTAPANSTDLINEVHKITPVLTLLMRSDAEGGSSSTSTASSHLTCVKLVGDEDLAPDSESSAPLLQVSYVASLLVMVVCTALSWF